LKCAGRSSIPAGMIAKSCPRRRPDGPAGPILLGLARSTAYYLKAREAVPPE
jgi:hypothetical protein